MKKLSILLAGVCLTAALYGAGTIYGQNKTKRRQSHNKQIPRRNDQRQSQRKSDKATS